MWLVLKKKIALSGFESRSQVRILRSRVCIEVAGSNFEAPGSNPASPTLNLIYAAKSLCNNVDYLRIERET